MTDLRKLMKTYQDSRLKYPSAGRRDAEDGLLNGLIAVIEEMDERLKPKPAPAKPEKTA